MLSAKALVALTLETVILRRTASGFTLIVPDADTDMYRSGVAASAPEAMKSEPTIMSATDAKAIDFLLSFIGLVSHAFADV